MTFKLNLLWDRKSLEVLEDRDDVVAGLGVSKEAEFCT